MKEAVPHTDFELQYLSLREKEGRLYADEEVKELPAIRPTHPLKKEWKIRGASCQRFRNYLTKKKRPLRVLEIGCGNGWFAHQLSLVRQTEVMGLDINLTELAQAKRVFPQLAFYYGSPDDLPVVEQFDIIVFAASFQYFDSPDRILPSCFSRLATGGEVHVIDTNFYSEAEAEGAEARSQQYFTTAGFPQMRSFYFHHSWRSLEGYNFEILFDPRQLFHRIFHKTPFYWIRIQP